MLLSNEIRYERLDIPLLIYTLIPAVNGLAWPFMCLCSFSHNKISYVFILCAAILFAVVKSQLPLNLLDPLYCCHPPHLHSPADVRQGRLVVPAVYLLPFRGFTWEATAQINSLNSHCSVGTSFSLPHLLAHSLRASPSTSSVLSLHLSLSLFISVSFPVFLPPWPHVDLSISPRPFCFSPSNWWGTLV